MVNWRPEVLAKEVEALLLLLLLLLGAGEALGRAVERLASARLARVRRELENFIVVVCLAGYDTEVVWVKLPL